MVEEIRSSNMIGAKQIVLDASDIVKGMSSGPDITDGGFSNETNAVNLIYNPGVINGVPAMSDNNVGGIPSGECIAHTPSDVTGTDYILQANGKVALMLSGVPSSESAALAGTFRVGTSDIVNFFPSGGLDKLYMTSTTDVARMDTDLTNGDPTWWSVTATGTGAPFGALSSTIWHPMLNYIGYVYFADGNVIHRIDSNVAGTKNVLVLNQQNQITALGIDISTGQMLIAATLGANYGGASSGTNRVFVWDGVSSAPSREIPVDGMITGFRNVGGVTYCAYPQSVGYWNGSGVSFLRRLKNVTLTAADLPYKHHLSNVGNTLYVVDGNQVLAYGEVLPGRRVWYYALYNTVGSNLNLSLVYNVGNNKIGVAFATAQLYTLDILGTGVGSLNTLKTLRYSFPRPAFIRGVNLEYGGAGVANGYTSGILSYRTQRAATSTTNMALFPNNTGGTVWESEGIIGISEKVKWVQFHFTSVLTAGLRRMIIYYDIAE